ncbi:hypothetical protein LCGC14_0766690 [marine sediment metagenome]|uniref:Uncharacterized protein n=1 Tax=marine sediment metagenome TaxID=412755 RepID=A0A0F9PZP1_9ZZZZ
MKTTIDMNLIRCKPMFFGKCKKLRQTVNFIRLAFHNFKTGYRKNVLLNGVLSSCVL